MVNDKYALTLETWSKQKGTKRLLVTCSLTESQRVRLLQFIESLLDETNDENPKVMAVTKP